MASFISVSPLQWFHRFQKNMTPLADYAWDFPFLPTEYGFRPEAWTDHRNGKIADWVQSIPGNGRLHAQLFETGVILFHWDQKDPAQGQVVEHVLQESKAGPWLLMACLVGGALAVSNSLEDSPQYLINWKKIRGTKAPQQSPPAKPTRRRKRAINFQTGT